MADPLPNEDMKGPGVLVVGPNVWGKGKTIKVALERARKPKSYIAFAVPFPLSEIHVNDWGEVVWPGTRGLEGEIGAPFRVAEVGMEQHRRKS